MPAFGRNSVESMCDTMDTRYHSLAQADQKAFPMLKLRPRSSCKAFFMTLVDSLPYYDEEVSEAERDAVDLLVQRELAKIGSLHPSIAPAEDWSPSSVLMQQELDRVARGEKLEAIDLSRYEDVEAPDTENIQDWRDAVDRNIIATDAMSSRMDNLSLLKSHGPNAWTMHVFQLEFALKQVESELLALRQATEQVNVDRKRAQLAVGEDLTHLGARWKELISANLEVNVACAVLEDEINQLSQ